MTDPTNVNACKRNKPVETIATLNYAEALRIRVLVGLADGRDIREETDNA